ncbi:MAG: hypothetical protein ACE5GA_02105, partial [Candidatus Zixiibacteriota bacterium]
MLDKLHGRRLWALLFALLCLAAFLRLYDLTADPPNHFASLGQALLTDPYHITVHARNKALFGEWEPFGYERWVAFKVSLVSALAYLMFSLSEVSRYTANLTSVILNLLASSLIVLGLLRSRVQTECQPASSAPLSALVAGTLLALSHPLIVYSRTPFLENGLLALSAATFYVSIAHRRSLRGAALAGVLAVLCPLAGKLFGALIVFPAVLAIALSGQGAARRLAVFAGSAALTVFLWYVFVLGDQAGEYHAYLQEQSFGLYGAPPGLTSIKTFIMLLVTYGAEFRLFYFEVAIPLLLLLAALWLFVRFRPEVWKRDLGFWRERPALTFLVVWAVVAWLGLMVFHYRPLRYSLFVLVPLIGIIGALLGDALSARVQDEKRLKSRLRSKRRALVSSAAVTLIIWIAVVQGIIAFTPDSQIRPSAVSNVWISLLVSVVAGILLWVGWRAMSRFVHGDSFRHIVAIALALGL